MIKTVISDFSRTILFPKDPVTFLELNEIHKQQVANILNKNVFALDKDDFTLKESLYRLEDIFEVNTWILDLYKKLKQQGAQLILFTNSYIPSHPDLGEYLNIFDKVINVYDLTKLSKKDPQSYKILCDYLSINPSETLFIDDDSACLKSAQQIGITTIQFPKIKAFTTSQRFEELSNAVAGIEVEVRKLVDLPDVQHL